MSGSFLLGTSTAVAREYSISSYTRLGALLCANQWQGRSAQGRRSLIFLYFIGSPSFLRCILLLGPFYISSGGGNHIISSKRGECMQGAYSVPTYLGSTRVVWRRHSRSWVVIMRGKTPYTREIYSSSRDDTAREVVVPASGDSGREA